MLSAVSSNGNNEDTVNVQLLDQPGNPLPIGNGGADERARQNLHVVMCRLNAMLSDENLLNHARQVQMQALAIQIKDSMQFAKDML